MKSEEEIKILKDLENYRRVISHLRKVHENGVKLAEKLIEIGRPRFARRVTIEIFKHDLSKLGQYEYVGFFSGEKDKLADAIRHHQLVNPHHLEYYESYKEIPELQLAIIACDLKARSEEFGNDVKTFLKGFCEKKNISPGTDFNKKIKQFLNLIIEDKFQ